MADQPVDHRAEAAKALNLALTWLAAPQPDSGKATAYAAVGIGFTLLALRQQPATTRGDDWSDPYRHGRQPGPTYPTSEAPQTVGGQVDTPTTRITAWPGIVHPANTPPLSVSEG